MIAEISISRIRLVWKWKECHARMAIPNASEHATAGAWGHFDRGVNAAHDVTILFEIISNIL